jgi:diacylglycerol kinase (ATP)
VVNPAAGGGRARRLLPAVSGVLDAAGAGHQVRASASLEHAKELAVAAAGRGDVVVAFGGDGMVGALAGVVAEAGGTFGIIPAGRGNDFARTLGIPFGAADAARVLVGGQPRRVDLLGVGREDTGETTQVRRRAETGGRAEAGERAAAAGSAEAAGPAGDGGELIVAGSVYLGIPAVAAEIATRSRVPPGELAYPAAALRAVIGWRTARFRLELDGGTGPTELAEPGERAAARVREFDGSAVVLANSRYFGAGMMVAPEADPADGLLEVVYIQGASKAAMIRGLTKIKNGTHVSMDQIGTGRARAVTVTVGRAMPGGADGELLSCASPLDPGTSLRIRVLPGVLEVIS